LAASGADLSNIQTENITHLIWIEEKMVAL